MGSMMTISPFSIDMYLPAFSQIAKDFGTSSTRVALSVTTYFLGVAIGQIYYGPLLDRFGRKKPLYYGLSIYMLATFGCALSKNLEWFLFFRFVQALGGCSSMVAALTMVRDFFPVNQSAKIISLLFLIVGISPLLAPTIGGIIVQYLGWHCVFYILALIVSIILAGIYFFLPEKYQPDPSISLKIKPIFATFLRIMKNPIFQTYSFASAFSFATLFIFVAGSPYVFLELFKVSPQNYGLIFATLVFGFIGGGQLNIQLLKKFTSEQIFKVGLITQVVFTLLFLIGALKDVFTLPTILPMFFICLSCLGLTYPNAAAIALAPFTKNLGSASALIGVLQIGIAGLTSSGVGFFDSSYVPMIGIMFFTAVIALGIYLHGMKRAAISVNESEQSCI